VDYLESEIMGTGALDGSGCFKCEMYDLSDQNP
jgi:hypothetical protein